MVAAVSNTCCPMEPILIEDAIITPPSPQQQQQFPTPVYKEVVVIGNGPSGIALSYFLAGNWPYYNGNCESVNEMLHYRLLSANKSTLKAKKASRLAAAKRPASCFCLNEDLNSNQTTNGNLASTPASAGEREVLNNNNNDWFNQNMSSLVEQDLKFLGQGLEGRSTNPTALLFDILNHPNADLGLELPSLLTWSYNQANTIDHVVIGKGAPGGTWQTLDGSVLTISLGCWMELPQLNFREWESTQESRCYCESRATVASVAQYYCDYVNQHGLDKYFLNDSIITKVTKIQSSSQEDSDSDFTSDSSKCLPNYYYNCDNNYLSSQNCIEDDEFNRRHSISAISTERFRKTRQMNTDPEMSPLSTNNPGNHSTPLWKVDGFSRTFDPLSASIISSPFTFLTSNLVLATGSSDKSNILNIPGEDLPFVLHSLTDLERLIASGHLNSTSDPVMLVGAGLCAADAIIAAKFYSIPVVHVFRRNVEDPALIFKQLPENMYPEYHKVYQMMKDSAGYDGYKAYQQHKVTEITNDHCAKIQSKNGLNGNNSIKVSYILICIGSHPDLSLLGSLETEIGLLPNKPIDCKINPIEIDTSTHQSIHQPGLYAMGPLVGENFVRFLQGGALAITNHLVNVRKNNSKATAASSSSSMGIGIGNQASASALASPLGSLPSSLSLSTPAPSILSTINCST